MGRAIRNAPYKHLFALYDNSAHDLVDAPATFDAKILGDDDPTEAATNNAAARVGTTTGYCSVALDFDEFTYERCGIRVEADSTNSRIDWVRTEPCIDSGVAQAGTARTITLRSGNGLAANQVKGHVIELVSGTGAGQTRVIVSNDASDVVTVDRAWSANPDSTTVYIIHPYKGPFFLGAAQVGTVSDTAAAANEFDGDSDFSATDDIYNSWMLTFLTGTNAGITRKVDDYVGSTNTFSFAATTLDPGSNWQLLADLYNIPVSDFEGVSSGPFPSAPANGDVFLLFARVFA